MKDRRLLWVFIPLLVLALLAVPVARFFWFYRGLPLARDVKTPKLSQLSVPTPASADFVDKPTAGHGFVLVDRGHDNLYTPNELSVLTARLTARGLIVREFASSDNLELALRPASAFVVITPGRGFSPDEVTAVRRFVARGGRLLLVADPTRYATTYDDYGSPSFADSAVLINPLAIPFGISFEDDYLYNVVRHEGNYQNIQLDRFAESKLTAGLSHVTFYATHSIHAAGHGLILADADTHSSTDELGRDLAVAALDESGKVLLLGDLSFMTSAYASVMDNARLVANIADFLAAAERRFSLDDFPYFFGDGVTLVPLGAFRLGTGQVESASLLQESLRAADRRTAFRDAADAAMDTLFFGIFSDTTGVDDLLDVAGITIDVEEGEEGLSYTLRISGTGEVDGAGMALFLLQQEQGRSALVLLADSGENLQAAIQTLTAGDLSGCLALRDTLVLCAAGAGGGGGWGDGGDNNGGGPGNGGEGGGLLVVAEDDLFMTTDCTVGGFYYESFLFSDYAVEAWSEYDQGNPTLADLQKYDAVLWVAGDCSGAPSEEDTVTLRAYVAAGGRLLLEGAYIGKDWAGSDFYAEVCHAKHVGNSGLLDLAVVDATHPLAQGWDEGQTMAFIEGSYDIQPDVVEALTGTTVVFARGPSSADAGTPAVIAYQNGATRVVYVNFPLFLLGEEDLAVFLYNAAAWLLEKP